MAMKGCLERSGYIVTTADDGGISVRYALEGAPDASVAELRAAYDKTIAACLHETGYDRAPRVDPEEDYRQQTAADDCLRAHGVPVVSPSLEEFKRGVVSDRLSVLPKDPDKLAQLKQACHL